MKALLAAVLVLTAVSARAAATSNEVRIADGPAAVLADILRLKAGNDAFGSMLDDLILCKMMGNPVRVVPTTHGGALLLCDRTRSVAVPLTSDDLAAYNRLRNATVRVSDGVLGYGAGNPTAGLPSANFTPINDAALFTALTALGRERIAQPAGPGAALILVSGEGLPSGRQNSGGRSDDERRSGNRAGQRPNNDYLRDERRSGSREGLPPNVRVPRSEQEWGRSGGSGSGPSSDERQTRPSGEGTPFRPGI